ncbi:TPA: hypothetical protein DEP96_03755 [Candidatus Uhrbacteria bacterium]|nr:hypothetical protein [Candidatus Uhrbacteria bacterium]
MQKPLLNNAYIDGANLHNGISAQGWKLDYRSFRAWLKEKYGVRDAYLFIGLMPDKAVLYTNLQRAGFILIFKDVVYNSVGKAKGNCDADLVLQCVVDFFNKKYEQAIIVSSDGDYACLVKFLQEQDAMRIIVSPSIQQHCSILLKKTGAPIAHLSEPRLRPFLEYGNKSKNKEAPDADGTVIGSSS